MESGKINKKVLIWTLRAIGTAKIYIAMLVIIQALIGISSVGYAIVLREIIDVAVSGYILGFRYYLFSLVLLVVFQILLRAESRFLEEYSRAVMENTLKKRLFSSLLYGEYDYVSGVHSAEFMNRLTSDTVVVSDAMAQIIPGITGMTVKMIGAIGMILILEPIFGYVLIPGGALLIISTYWFRKKLKKLHKKVQESDGKLRVFLQESLTSMIVVRAFVNEQPTLDTSFEKMRVHKNIRIEKNHFSNLCNIGFGVVMQGSYVLGIGVCSYKIITGEISYGTMVAILQLISQIQTPFANITSYIPKYYAMLASSERLIEAEILSRQRNTESNCFKSIAEINEFYQNEFNGILLENISFNYSRNSIKNTGIKNFNMDIEKGDCIAFTGSSGCGKSTILKLLMCIYPLDSGEQWIKLKNGFKIKLTQAYRRLFAYVPQGNHLMSGTIREIVAYGKKEAIKNDDEIWEALRISCAENFVKELEFDLDTALGERGLGLSEGQMQRIAIARALFSGKPIILLDESTSALDEKTEAQLLNNLNSMTDKTIFIVTHKQAILNICNKELKFSE